jgi:hypothetical protein
MPLTPNQTFTAQVGVPFIAQLAFSTISSVSSINNAVALAVSNKVHGRSILILKNDGTVVEKYDFDEDVVANNVTAISQRGDEPLALLADGTVKTWGLAWGLDESYFIGRGITNATAIATTFSTTSGGTGYAVQNGQVIVWGYVPQINDDGETWLNFTQNLTEVQSVSAGPKWAFFLKLNGQIAAISATVPGPGSYIHPAQSYAISLSAIEKIDSNEKQFIALKNDGTALYFEEGFSQAVALNGVSDISAGKNFCYALKTDGIYRLGASPQKASSTNATQFAAGFENNIIYQQYNGIYSQGGSYSFQATNLPSWATLNSSTGVIAGSPTAVGTQEFQVNMLGLAGIDSKSVSVAVAAGTPIITPGQSFTGTVGTAFSSTVALSDSTNRPATSFTATGLPAWATLSASTGQITGTPTAAGTTSASVTATGPGGTSTATTVAFVITSSGGGGGGGGTTTTRFMIAPTQTFTASLGVLFEATPVLLQGTAATWYASGLPAWATIDPTTGKITGTPTFSGVTSFNLSAIDEENNYSSAQATLAVTAWNVREIFVDVRDKKILSVANSRYPLSKITLKRDDKTPFRIIFVDGETPFSIPESFSVSVGLKKNFTDEEYLAFSPDITGTLDLSSEPIQELFLGGAESTTGFFEVKWEDGTSAFRTVKLAAEIQNSVIRGNDYTAAAYLGADAVTTAASTSAQVRAIGAPIFGPAKGNSYTIDISPGDKRISIAYPSALGDLASVRYNQFNNSEVLDTFTKTSVQVSTSGNTASLYFVYTYTASIPFEDFATYTVTL